METAPRALQGQLARQVPVGYGVRHYSLEISDLVRMKPGREPGGRRTLSFVL
jgi:hypothetical protein